MPANETVVAAALEQIEQGFAVFALRADAKVPVTANGFKNATRRPDWIRRQLEAPAAGNYGLTWPVDAGWTVVVLDLDDGGGADRPWQDRLLDLMAAHGPLPPTKATTTPSGGRHAFYRWPDGVPVPPGDELFGFTVRWPGRGYLVGPGSRIGDRPYVAGATAEIAELPDAWVRAAIAEHPARRAAGDDSITFGGQSFALPDRIPAGRRYATVRDYVASRYNAGLGLEELWDLVRTQVAPRFDVGKTEQELRADFDRVTSKLVERLGPPAAARRDAQPAPVGELVDAPLTEFESRPIEWVWPSWLPRGVVTLMDGNPGVSKSTLVADLVARITTARDWPDGSQGTGTPGRVIWITTEDDPGRVLRPRVEAAGGDPGLVRFVTSEVVFPDAAAAFLELLVRRAVEPDGLVLVVLDPLFSHVGPKVRTISDSEMRSQVMRPLQEAAEAANVAVLLVRHFSKDTKASPINRGAGSLGGIVGAARSLWTAVVDPEDDEGATKIVGVSKSNYARIPAAWRYRVEDRTPPGWLTGTVPVVSWLEPAGQAIEAILDAGADGEDAAHALDDILTKGPLGAKAIFATMQARGFGRHATRGAKARLHVEAVKSGFGSGWLWRLPDEDPDSSRRRIRVERDSTPDSSAAASTAKGREESGPDSSDSSRLSRAGARRGRDSEPDSSDSSEGPKGPKNQVTDRSRARPPERVREAGPELRVIDGDATTVVSCHFYRDHQGAHHRGPDGAYHCRICSPCDASSGCSTCLEEGA